MIILSDKQANSHKKYLRHVYGKKTLNETLNLF